MTTFDVGSNSLILSEIASLAAVAILVPHVELSRMPMHDRFTGSGRELRPRRVHVDAQLLAESHEESLEVVGHIAAGPDRDRAVIEAEFRVRDDQFRIHLAPRSQTRAIRTGTKGRIEGEGTRFKLFKGETVLGASKMLAEGAFAARILLIQVHEFEDDETIGELECGFNRIGEPSTC